MENSFFKSVKKAISNWYIPLIIGLFFIVVSFIIMMNPTDTFLTLAVLFSMLFTLSGLSEMVFSYSNRKQLDNWGWFMAYGAITFIIGIILLSSTALSAATLALVVGFLLLFRSISFIGYAIDLKNYNVPNWGWTLAFGILSAIISILLIFNPLIAGLSIVVLVSLNFFIIGALSIYFSLQLRKIHTSSKKISQDLQDRYDALMVEINDELRM